MYSKWNTNWQHKRKGVPAPESVVPRPCALATECRRPARLRELKHLYIDVYVIFKLYKVKKMKRESE